MLHRLHCFFFLVSNETIQKHLPLPGRWSRDNAVWKRALYIQSCWSPPEREHVFLQFPESLIYFPFFLFRFFHFATYLRIFPHCTPLKFTSILFCSFFQCQTLRRKKFLLFDIKVSFFRSFVHSLLPSFLRSAFLVRISYHKRKLIEEFNQNP